uniref:uncharacterized protein n=1 Tax=Myxine glutinosa TaxID=7769 RepID=UPI00358E2C10
MPSLGADVRAFVDVLAGARPQGEVQVARAFTWARHMEKVYSHCQTRPRLRRAVDRALRHHPLQLKFSHLAHARRLLALSLLMSSLQTGTGWPQDLNDWVVQKVVLQELGLDPQTFDVEMVAREARITATLQLLRAADSPHRAMHTAAPSPFIQAFGLALRNRLLQLPRIPNQAPSHESENEGNKRGIEAGKLSFEAGLHCLSKMPTALSALCASVTTAVDTSVDPVTSSLITTPNLWHSLFWQLPPVLLSQATKIYPKLCATYRAELFRRAVEIQASTQSSQSKSGDAWKDLVDRFRAEMDHGDGEVEQALIAEQSSCAALSSTGCTVYSDLLAELATKTFLSSHQSSRT